ncbi:hypothetical protein [Leptospira licerasiae]|uniref:hypothetical protein n=1 Tax=Leptospira licerasiae TaxID=447106 RepID=UPI001083A212|nr:hypothetical protein [Leptospira licerasiae]TGM88996.1 hypothetical protein EHR05_12405 [Leptospira licerasiae]
MIEEYGNSFKTVKKVTVVGLIIGLVLILVIGGLSFSKSGYLDGELLLKVLPFALSPAILLFLMILPSALFRIRIEGESIKNIFLSKHVISSYSIKDLEVIKMAEGIYAAVLIFKNGKIRIFAMSLRERERLITDIRKLSKRELSIS